MHQDLHTLINTDDVLISTSITNIDDVERVIISFTGIGHAMGGIDVQKVEFAGFSLRQSGVGFITITDKKRSWGNNLDVGALVKLVRDLADDRPIHLIGNSMGGFLAILFSGGLKARSTLAFAAQFSVLHDIMPDEHRWDRYVRSIRQWRYPSLDGMFDKDCVYQMVHGSHASEKRHWSRMSRGPNIHHFVVAQSGHNVASRLKEVGVLDQIVNAGVRGDMNASLFERVGVDLVDPSDT